MIRTDRYKLISRVSGRDEFYDLNKDPAETQNVIDDPELLPVIRELEQKLRLWLMRTADIVPYRYDRRFSEEMVWAKVKRLVPSEYEEEIRGKIRSGANMFLMIHECQKRFGSTG